MSNRKLISRHLLSWQTSWSSRSVRRKQWLWKAFHVGWQIEAWANQSSSLTLKMPYWPWIAVKTWALDGGFDLPTSLTEILVEVVVNFVDSALGQTQSYDWKTPRSAQESHSLCQFQPLVVTFCIGTKQNHDPRDTDCNRNEAAITSQWTLAPMS